MNIVARLNDHNATPETILEILHTTVAEVSEDLTEEEMLGEMRRSARDEARFDALRTQFERDPNLVREAALAWLAVSSDDPGRRDIIESAVEDADRNAPLIEVAAITIIALYAMYLIATQGVKETTRKIEHKKDGTYSESEKRVYHSFSEPVKGAVELFKAAAGAGVSKLSGHKKAGDGRESE